MKTLVKVSFIAALSLGLSLPAAARSQSFSSSQKKQIEQVIHNYLINNPEVLVEASKSLQKKQQQNMMQQAQSAIEANSQALFNDKNSPVVGNAKGKVTVVEFFDYQCVHCKKMAPVMAKLVADDPSVRVVYKDFPIFGKGSEFAARAALAAQMQGKYESLHQALIHSEQRLNPAVVIKLADGVGINTTKLKADMKSEEVQKQLETTMHLAEQLHLMGTPAFVVASTPNGQYKKGGKSFFIPGAASLQNLQSMIKQL